MPLPPSRRDTIGPPPRDVSDLAARSRHQGSYLRSLDPGIQEGRWRTPTPVPKGPPPQLVGGDAAGDDTDYAWEFDDRHTITALGTQRPRLSHVPIDESLHVFWHPGGDGDVRVTSEFFTVDEQIVTIPDPGYFAIGDTFSFQYEYEVSDEVLEFEFIGATEANGGYPDYTISIPLPDGTQDGDLLIVAARGTVAAGGGDLVLGISSADSRITSLYGLTAPPVAERIFTGFATSSTADVLLNIIPNPSYTGSADAVLVVLRGVNAVGEMSVANTGSLNTTAPTPRVPGLAAVAVTWAGNDSFGVFGPSTPDGYTFAGYTGLAYGNTTISWWYDPAAETSPSGNYVDCEGCCVFALV